jgi:opacity protein-like surface antigen
MKMIKFCLLITSVIISTSGFAQQTSKKSGKKHNNNGDASSKYSFYIGGGMASYLGDLTEGTKIFNKPGWAVNAGVIYDISKNLSAKLDMGLQKVQASDSKNSSANLKNRSLSFTSNVFDVSLSAEYTVMDMNKHKISPFVSVGVGALFFSPYAYDGLTGKRVYLRELGTEGQGLVGYSDFYSGVSAELPLGVGAKYRVNDNLTVKFEFNYRLTNTDYLDDVSKTYPSKAGIDARDPVTSKFTFRGPGSYPATGTPRGNPKKNDAFYTTELKLVFRL